MNFRNISAWSIRNPVIPLVAFTALLLAGLISFARMDVVNNPDIEFPAVNVSVSQPGAAPTEIENQITQRVESAVRSINGVKSINSTAREGNSNTFIEHAALTHFWAERLGRESFSAFQASQRGGYAHCRRDGDRAVLSGPCVTVVEGRFYLPQVSG